MSDIFTYESQDIDLKECIKLRTNCQQLDTAVLQFNVFNYDSPVDLTNFNVELIAVKPDGTFYRQVDNIIKNNNQLTISCYNQLTAVVGKIQSELRIWDNSNNQKSSYFILLNVSGLVSDEDRVVSRNYVDVLERFDNDVNIALKLSEVFKDDIDEAQIISNDFATKIPLANSVDVTLNNTINNANSINTTLNSTINTGNTLENKLSSDIISGTTLKNNLEANISTAGITNDNLTTTIGNADTKLQEFQSYDTTGLVPLSNTMLNDMYCNNQLLSINHGLNGYPVVKLTYTEYGAGVGGAGNFPAGADSDCNLMQNKTIYTDTNNLTIYVPQNYYIANPSVQKINDYKYVVTFLNSTRSILIELIKGSVEEDINSINQSVSQNIQDINTLATNVSQLSNPNLLINGDFQVWQRGTSFTNVDNCKYTADRWQSNNSISGGLIVEKSSSGLSMLWSTSCTGILQYSMGDNDKDNYIGKPLTFSISIGGIVYTYTTTITNAYAYIKFDLSTKTFSMMIGDTTTLIIYIVHNDAPSGTTYIINYCKLEAGNLATPFVPKLYWEEFYLCQIYYEKTDNDDFFVASLGADSKMHFSYHFKTKKRTLPTVSFGHEEYGNNHMYVNKTDLTGDVVVYSDIIKENHCRFYYTPSDTTIKSCIFNGYIEIDAEVY